MDKVRNGEIPWTNLDDLQRIILEDLLKQYKIEELSEEEALQAGSRDVRVGTVLSRPETRGSNDVRGPFR